MKSVKIKDIVQTVIFLCCLIIMPVFAFSYFLYDQTSLKDYEIIEKSFTVMIGIFGGTATLVAAYIASLLFNDWRLQKDHDTKTTYLNNAIQSLSEIHVSLIICRDNANNLKKIGSNLILMSEYIESFSKSHNKLLISIYSNLVVAEKIFGNKNLLDNYNKYDKYIYEFDNYNQKLLRKYKTYFYYYINTYSADKSKTNISLFRSHNNYGRISDITHTINAAEISKFFTTELVRIMGEKQDSTNYDFHVEECIALHNTFLDACIEQLKAK